MLAQTDARSLITKRPQWAGWGPDDIADATTIASRAAAPTAAAPSGTGDGQQEVQLLLSPGLSYSSSTNPIYQPRLPPDPLSIIS